MNIDEREALLNYLDFHMMTLVRKYEQYLDPAAVHALYDDVYYIMSDMENTISTQQIIEAVVNNKS